MNNIKLMMETTAFSAVAAGIGYASALIFPTITPIAGAINGFCLGFALSSTGKSFSALNREGLPFKDTILHFTIITTSLVASAALSFLICFSFNNPVSFSACLVFPWIMSFSSVLLLLPVATILKIAQLVHNTYLRLTV